MKRTYATSAVATLAGIFLSSALSGCSIPLFERASSPDPDGASCGNVENLNATMKKKYAEEPAIVAQLGLKSAIVLFATPPGAKLDDGKAVDTWTLFSIPDTREKSACKVAFGEHFRMVTNRKERIVPGSRNIMYTPPASPAPSNNNSVSTAPCMPHQKVTELYEKKAGMVRLAYGQVGKNVLEIYGVPVGTTDVLGAAVPSSFLMIETDVTGLSCLRGAGKNIGLNPEMLAKYPKDPKPGF